jgi:tetratricopeptide (TPR) repeat protein
MKRYLPAYLLLPFVGALWLAPPCDRPACGQQLPSRPEPVPKFDGLGKHTRPVSANPEAQAYFDQGLAFLYAFNHDEAIRSFEQAAKLDPECAMAHWGVALACGGHINKPLMEAERAKQAFAAAKRAERHVMKATAADAALIGAVARRYADPPASAEEQAKLNAAYSKAMKAVWEKFPKDADAGAIYAESLMNLRPWDLWTLDGQPREETPELVATLEAVLKLNPDHPFALHLYIHAVEASPEPGKATEAADRLRHLQPGLGHMVHMPSHIDVRCGRWQQAVEANERAIRADAAYTKRVPEQGFYRLYMAHNHHMLAFAAMQSGQSTRALGAVREMLAGVPKEWVAVPENAAVADGFLAAPLEVMIRFGKWDNILKEPEFPAGFPIAAGLRHHARGVAYAAKGDTKAARAEWEALRAAAKVTPKEAKFGNNTAADLFAVADPMLEGEILAAEGRMEDALKSLTTAAAKEDTLNYDEPPDWVVPVRHALGAFLLKDGQAAEAEVVYRQDLKKWPENGWALYGLAASLEAQGKGVEAEKARARWRKAWANADIDLTSSCLCVKGVGGGR